MGYTVGVANKAASAAQTLPAFIANSFTGKATDLFIWTIVLSPQTSGLTTPPNASWTLIKDTVGGQGPQATDTSTMRVLVYRAPGNTTPNSILVDGTVSCVSQQFHLFSGYGSTWTVQTTGASQNTISTAWSQAGDTSISLEPGDLIMNIRGISSDTPAVTAASTTLAGITYKTGFWGSVNQAVATGSNHNNCIFMQQVTAGTASGVPTLTSTNSSTGGSGAMSSIIIRNSGTAVSTGPTLIAAGNLITGGSNYTGIGTTSFPSYSPGDKIIHIMLLRPGSMASPAAAGGWTKVVEGYSIGGTEGAGTGSTMVTLYEIVATSYTSAAPLTGSTTGGSLVFNLLMVVAKDPAKSWASPTVTLNGNDGDISTTAVAFNLGGAPGQSLLTTDLLFLAVGQPNTTIQTAITFVADSGGTFALDTDRDYYISNTTGNDGAVMITPWKPSANATYPNPIYRATASVATASSVGAALIILRALIPPPQGTAALTSISGLTGTGKRQAIQAAPTIFSYPAFTGVTNLRRAVGSAGTLNSTSAFSGVTRTHERKSAAGTLNSASAFSGVTRTHERRQTAPVIGSTSAFSGVTRSHQRKSAAVTLNSTSAFSGVTRTHQRRGAITIYSIGTVFAQGAGAVQAPAGSGSGTIFAPSLLTATGKRGGKGIGQINSVSAFSGVTRTAQRKSALSLGSVAAFSGVMEKSGRTKSLVLGAVGSFQSVTERSNRFGIIGSAAAPQERMQSFATNFITQGNGVYTLGTRFTCNLNGVVTHIKFYYLGGWGDAANIPHEIALYRNSDTVKLGSTIWIAPDTSASGSGWKEIALPAPIPVVAGVDYTTAYSPNGAMYTYWDSVTSLTPNLTLLGGFYVSGDAQFPSVTAGQYNYTQDVVYQAGSGGGGGIPFTSTSALTANGGAGTPRSGTASLFSNATLSLTGKRGAKQTAALNSIASSSATRIAQRRGSGTINSTSAFSGIVRNHQRKQAALTIGSTSALSATRTAQRKGIAALASSSSITATGVGESPPPEGIIILNTADAIYLGSVPATKVYLGTKQVWPASTWSPLDITGLLLWFDASVLSTGNVSPWPNLGSGPAGTIVGTPVPVVEANVKNGLSAVHFKPNEGRMRTSGTGAGVAGLNWTVIYVACANPGSPAGRIVNAIYTPSNLLIGFWNGFVNAFYIEGFLTPDTKRSMDSNWYLYSATGEGVAGDAKAWAYENGVFQAGNHPVTGGWQDTFAISGYDPSGSAETLDCYVAEVLFYNHRLPDAERNTVEDYLRTKWGL